MTLGNRQCRRHPAKTLLSLAAAAAGLALAAPARAAADSADLTLHVVNAAGVPQYAHIDPSTGSQFTTDVTGSADIGFVYPGVTVTVGRDEAGDGPCSAPEGSGITYTFPDPVPSDATITLPAFTQPVANDPGVTAADRYVLGLINQERAKFGRQPLTISTVPTESAHRYVRYLHDHNIDPVDATEAHSSLSGPYAGAEDVGWPDSQVGEIETSTDDPEAAFENWMHSGGHHDEMT